MEASQNLQSNTPFSTYPSLCYSINMSYELWTEKITMSQLWCTDDCLKEEEEKKKDWIYVQDNVEYSQSWLQASCVSLSSH